MGTAFSPCLSFGEVLFDRFPDRSRLGGAPLNFAWNLRQFGVPVAVVSAVGRDAAGAEIRAFMTRADIDRRWLGERPEPTGVVEVRLVDGEPTFTIHEGVAWDHIDVRRKPERRPPLLYYGTVARRTEHNRASWRRLLDFDPVHRLFDINLRQHYYSEAIVRDGLQEATIVKCNETEWAVVRRMTGIDAPERLLDRFGLAAVALTCGAAGAVLYTPDGVVRAPSPTVPVADTVGAGDAFSAALAAGMMKKADPARIVHTACAAGAAVVRHPGAQIILPDEVANAFA